MPERGTIFLMIFLRVSILDSTLIIVAFREPCCVGYKCSWTESSGRVADAIPDFRTYDEHPPLFSLTHYGIVGSNVLMASH